MYNVKTLAIFMSKYQFPTVKETEVTQFSIIGLIEWSSNKRHQNYTGMLYV